PEIVETGLPDLAVAKHLHAVDTRRVDQERALDADAVRHPPHREVPPRTSARHPDDEALEDLDALAGALDHLGVDADGVAGTEIRHLLLLLLALELVNDVHRTILSAEARCPSPFFVVLA